MAVSQITARPIIQGGTLTMLDSRKSKQYNENKVVSIIGPGTTIKGEITSKGTIRIEGEVSGRVQCADSIVVQESGRVKADLTAAQIIISGEVRGNVFAHERLEITAGGKVIGDITSPRIAMAEGVLFEGKCAMKASTPRESAKTETAAK